MTFEIYRRMTLFGKRWFWRLKGGNNEIIAVGGEGFHNKDDVLDIIDSIMTGADVAKVNVDLGGVK